MKEIAGKARRGVPPTVEQALTRFERRKRYASMAHELRQARTRRHLYNDLQRVEGVLYHRLREGMCQDESRALAQAEELKRYVRYFTSEVEQSRARPGGVGATVLVIKLVIMR